MDRSTDSDWSDEDLSHLFEEVQWTLPEDNFLTKSNIRIEDKSESQDQLVSKSVRKKRRIKQHDYIPRVVKHDIRRYYNRMLLNIWNSHDPKLFQSFLLTYATNNIVCRQMGTFSNVKFIVDSENLILCGVNIFAKFMGFVQQLVPDLTISMSDIRVISSSTIDGSIVKFRLINNVTNVFDFEAHEHIRLMRDLVFYDYKIVDSVVVDKECIEDNIYTSIPLMDSMRVYKPTVQSTHGFHMPNITSHFHSVFGRPPKLRNCLKSFTSEVDVIMRLNSCLQIEALEFYGLPKAH